MQIGKPDLCHVSVMLRTGIFAYWLKLTAKIKYVYTEHWTGYHPADGNYKGYKKLIYPFLLSRAERILPVTANLINVMKSHGIKGNYKQIGNVVDTSLFKMQESQPKDVKITALHVSNFVNQSKNISGLIEVVKKISQIRKDFKLNIVGDGASADFLKSYADQFDLTDKSVFFLGSKSGKDLVNEICQCDFLVMFSNYENQPCVISEAMACGKPVLATNVGGIPEMVNDKTGLLTSPGDVTKMAENFEIMLNNYQNFDKNLIREVAEDTYSYSKIGSQFFSVYMDVLSK